nr:11443_t:CDS:2 [Entrophospora candida]
MNNNIIFLFLFFLFATTINSFTIRKRADDAGKFTQCAGTFPITVTEDTYTPATIVPGETITEHVVWDSTVEVDPKTRIHVTITTLDGTPILSHEHTFCGSEAVPPEVKCPIPVGHLDYTVKYALPPSPDQPKAQTVQLYINRTLISPDKTTLQCVEGTITVAFP